jgi:NADH-quinone oxidoreductase subunit J
MLEKIVFIILSAVTLGSALMVVTQRLLFRAALFLVLTLAGVAGLFVLLDAGFLAVVQLFIYAGAISILIIFAVMLTRQVMNPTRPQLNTQWSGAVVSVLILFALLLLVLWPNRIALTGFNIGGLRVSQLNLGDVPWPEQGAVERVSGVGDLGRALVDSEQYVLPFEVASVLLLVAMVGAVYIVYPRRRTDEGQESHQRLDDISAG